jgi:hypothetical protein
MYSKKHAPLVAALVKFAFAQLLKKGNVIGVHVADVTLNRGVTHEQFEKFYNDTVIHAYNNNWPDARIILMKGIRGENENRIGYLYFFESEKVRNKYFNDDGTVTEAGKPISEKMKPVLDELAKSYGTETTLYTDWVEQ